MALIVVFKSIDGKQLLSLSGEHAQKAASEKIHNVVTLNFAGEKHTCRIVRIDRRATSPELFDQKEPMLAVEFTVKVIDDESA